MKKIYLCFLLSTFWLDASAQPTLIQGSTNSATVILQPDTNNMMTVAASSMVNDTGGLRFFGGTTLPVVSGILASNSFSSVLATNGMKNGDWRTISSNGVMTAVGVSNGASLYKQLAP